MESSSLGTPFNECGVDGFSGCISVDGFSGCIGSREVVSVLFLVMSGRSLLWFQLW